MSRRMFAALQSGHADAPQVSVVTPLEETMRELERFQPELVTAYPSVLAAMTPTRAMPERPCRLPRCSA